MDLRQKVHSSTEASMQTSAALERAEPRSLAQHYAARLREFEKERLSWLATVEKLKMDAQSRHEDERTLIDQRERLAEFQRAGRNALIASFEERLQGLSLRERNERLRVEDRLQTEEMKRLAESAEQRWTKSGMRATSVGKKSREVVTFAGDVPFLEAPGGAMKSTFQQTANEDYERLTRGFLIDDVDALRTLCEEYVAVLKEETEVARSEAESEEKELDGRLRAQREKLGRARTVMLTLNKLRFFEKKAYEERGAAMAEERRALKERNEVLNRKLEEKERDHGERLATRKSLARAKATEFKRSQETKLKSRESQLEDIKGQYLTIQQKYLEKIDSLQKDIAELQEKHEELEDDRNRKVSVLRGQLEAMKARVRSHEDTEDRPSFNEKSAATINHSELDDLKETLARIEKGIDKRS